MFISLVFILCIRSMCANLEMVPSTQLYINGRNLSITMRVSILFRANAPNQQQLQKKTLCLKRTKQKQNSFNLLQLQQQQQKPNQQK